MLVPTPQQLEQIELFFSLISENIESLLLHPVIDDKTGVERLGICVAEHNGPDDNSIYMLGLWFLPDDELFKRFSFKRSSDRIVTKRPNGVIACLERMKKKVCLWRV